ncbi:MAG: hypothetical protein DMG49_25470 [Acidobacteria bacterium]|nr:MAG: hypothetical protein DMG49_25470 [Acidobacteriota bacterium]
MSAEEESYATRPKLSSAKGLASKTEGGAPPPREKSNEPRRRFTCKKRRTRERWNERSFLSERPPEAALAVSDA